MKQSINEAMKQASNQSINQGMKQSRLTKQQQQQSIRVMSNELNHIVGGDGSLGCCVVCTLAVIGTGGSVKTNEVRDSRLSGFASRARLAGAFGHWRAASAAAGSNQEWEGRSYQEWEGRSNQEGEG
eukprot:1181696-Prorocentrum_minimum.AAC.1